MKTLILGARRGREIPPEGRYVGALVDCIDRGLLPDLYGAPKHKLELVFEAERQGSQERFFISHVVNLTPLDCENSKLVKILSAIRGRPFSRQELAGFDVFSLVRDRKPVSFEIRHSLSRAGREVYKPENFFPTTVAVFEPRLNYSPKKQENREAL